MGMEEDNISNNKVRIFVGGLGESVTDEDLRRLFGSLGTVESVQTIRTKGRSFAYLDFLPSPTDHKSLSKLFSKYNGCLWKGGKLRLEKAKENYLARLKRELEEDALADAEVVSSQPGTDLGPDKVKGVSLEEISKRESSKAKQLHIFFPRLRKVKSIPFSGTGKHKYSFQNIKVPPLPVHFCDCEEHCSPSGAERGKLSFDGAAESGGMNDEEINMMNAVMYKLFEKEKVSNTKYLAKEQDSFESPDALHSNECEVDSATDEDDDDLIINMETKKNKAALIGSQELERILENKESWLNKTRIAKEEPNKSTIEVQKRNNSNPNKKRKSLPNLEGESSGCVSNNPASKSNMQSLPDELRSGVQPTELEDGCGKSTKVSWSQKSSWRELLGDGGNTAFNASLILPEVDSDKDQQGSDTLCKPLYTNIKTENMERDEYLGSKPTNTQVIKELTEAQPTITQVIKEHAEAQPTDKNAAPNKTGRGASWRQKQSWTQLVGENNSFSISQILPGITFPEPMAKEPIVDPANSNDYKHNGVAKHTINEVVSNGFNLGKIIPEKSQHVSDNDIASAPIVEKNIVARPRERSSGETIPKERSPEETIPKERSSEETIPKERSNEDVSIGETCSFMRSAASLRDWKEAKVALSASLKRKRSEK